MKVKKLIQMLENHNLDADINFKINSNKSQVVQISTTAMCKCNEKEINFTIGER